MCVHVSVCTRVWVTPYVSTNNARKPASHTHNRTLVSRTVINRINWISKGGSPKTPGNVAAGTQVSVQAVCQRKLWGLGALHLQGFYQKGGQIFHVCAWTIPCKEGGQLKSLHYKCLYRTFLKYLRPPVSQPPPPPPPFVH